MSRKCTLKIVSEKVNLGFSFLLKLMVSLILDFGFSELEKNVEMERKNKKEDEKLTNSASTSIDQDSLKSIVQKYNHIRSQLSQFQKVNEELKQQKDNSETNNDILKSQIAEYEKRILDLKYEFLFNINIDEKCIK